MLIYLAETGIGVYKPDMRLRLLCGWASQDTERNDALNVREITPSLPSTSTTSTASATSSRPSRTAGPRPTIGRDQLGP